jgi:hypothetical protein
MPSKKSGKKTVSTRGKAISAHREKHGDSANWKKLFAKLDKKKK